MYFSLPNISLTPCTSNSKSTVGICNQNPLFPLYYINSQLVTLLKFIDAPIQTHFFFILLLVSISSILAFRYAFFLFLKCLLASLLTLLRISTPLLLGSCTYCILACFLCSKKPKHSPCAASFRADFDSL